MPFKRGARCKHKNNIVISELNKLGYTANNLHSLLECTKGYSYKVLLNPKQMRLGQLIAVSWALNKPLGWVLNSLLNSPKDSLHWLDESFDLDKKIKSLKG